METWAHTSLATAAAVAFAHVCPASLVDVAVTIAVAAVTGGGKASPDLDNCGKSKAIDGALPDEALGGGGPLGHRQLLHSWMIPTAAWILLAPHATGPALAALRGAVTGWGSHIASDAVFGLPGPGHGRGVPLILWYVRFGGWLRANGWLEHCFGATCVAAAAWWGIGLAVHGLPYQPHPIALPELSFPWR